MTYFEAFILAVVAGITEFLPVSSTGHMILVSNLLGLDQTSFLKVFTVNIQFGAILAVVVLYWKRFFQSLDLYFKLLAAFVPTAIIGFLLNDLIDSLLENVVVVSIMLILGGIVLVFVDGWFKDHSEEKESTYLQSVKIGLFQCIAMVPGVSRSAATIIGGMTQGWSRKQAAEFSFLLAVPTMFAAASYKLLKSYKTIEVADIQVLALGNLVAFVVALLAIKFFIGFLTKHGFRYFGYYRIVMGTVILALIYFGVDLQLV